ncbi:nibrin [Venturia canescens]|uniref:nibrin n=1 Tax=Venturia canescens TaxID=32260 RepID=UPI001C9C0A47|nr:nibrin [Venturia canescens]
MWLLKDKAGNITYLTPGKTFNIGRKKGTLVLNDDSVSRNHATISILPKYHINQIKSNTQPLSECKIIDSGAKYGSTILRENEPDRQVTKEGDLLQHNDRIRFGVQESIFTVLYVPIITATSGLDKDEKSELQNIIDTLDGKVTMGWESLCTHMTLSEAKISEKLTCALAFGTPIVPMDFWRLALKAFGANEKMPEPASFTKHLNEKFTLFGQISLAPDSRRNNLFKGLTFVHFDSGQYSVHRRMIELAGGKSLLYRQKTHGTMNICDENVIVVQLVESNTTQATGTGDASYMAACVQLGEHRHRAIPASEIALAIIHCSTEKYCNPKYDHVGMFKRKKISQMEKSSILALDTQDVEIPGTNKGIRVGDPIESSGKKNPHYLKESTEYDSESQIDRNKLQKSLSNSEESCSTQTRVENRARTLVNPMASQLDEESIQVASLNYESCISSDSKIEENPKKRARDEENESFDGEKKKRISEESSGHRKPEEKRPRKNSASKDAISDDDNIIFRDEEPSKEHCDIETSARKSDERIQGNSPQSLKKPEPPLKNPFASQRKRSDEFSELSPPKPKSPDLRIPKSPNVSKTLSQNKSPVKNKTKLPSTPERGQRTLTSFLSPKKEMTEKTCWTSPKKPPKNKLDLVPPSPSGEFLKSEKTIASSTSFSKLKTSTNFLRVESLDVTFLSERKFTKKFSKNYQKKPPRVKIVLWNNGDTSKEENEEKSLDDESDDCPTKSSKGRKKMFRV